VYFKGKLKRPKLDGCDAFEEFIYACLMDEGEIRRENIFDVEGERIKTHTLFFGYRIVA
jgi:hypothetical protein